MFTTFTCFLQCLFTSPRLGNFTQAGWPYPCWLNIRINISIKHTKDYLRNSWQIIICSGQKITWAQQNISCLVEQYFFFPFNLRPGPHMTWHAQRCYPTAFSLAGGYKELQKSCKRPDFLGILWREKLEALY